VEESFGSVSVLPERHMNANVKPYFEPLPSAQRLALPAHERVLDRLADLLLDADEILHMLRADDAKNIGWLEPHIEIVCDKVNDVMKKLCD
jgi:hypothetical protein